MHFQVVGITLDVALAPKALYVPINICSVEQKELGNYFKHLKMI